MEKFRELGLSELTLAAIAAKGFEEPSAIQAAAIPLLMSGVKDVIGQAKTGTGKTAAFGIPIIETIKPGQGYIQAIILSPTRELAMQISEEMNSLCGQRKMTIMPVYGGQSIDIQMRKLAKGCDVVVGTPGRVMDLMRRKVLDLSRVTFAVLDEADEMLNMGFVEDMELILATTPTEKRMLMFSATMPKPIMNIAAKFMREYDIVSAPQEQATVELTEQIYYEVNRDSKYDALARIIDISPDIYAMVFCRTKSDVDELTARLNDNGYNVEALHGDISQIQRTKVIERFKRRSFSVLIATDVAARGIDVNDLTHVINYSIPQSTEAYVHRIGRTGRAGKTGLAVTFVTSAEKRRLTQIQREIKVNMIKGRLPGPEEIIKHKKKLVELRITEIIEKEAHLNYHDFATLLLEKIEPADLVAATLQMALKNELCVDNYQNLGGSQKRDKEERDDGGRVRMFVAAGKDDGFGAGKILDLIWEKTGIRGTFIGKIDCFDKFSFLDASARDAAVLENAFRNYGPGKAPFMAIARDRDGAEGDEPARAPRRNERYNAPTRTPRGPRIPRHKTETHGKTVKSRPPKKSFEADEPVKRPAKLSAAPEPPPEQKPEGPKRKKHAPAPPWVAMRKAPKKFKK